MPQWTVEKLKYNLLVLQLVLHPRGRGPSTMMLWT
jgi:hypothetical protein